MRVVNGCGADNLIAIVLDSIVQKGGLNEEDLGEKLIFFGADGHPSFQVSINGVTTQLKKGYASLALYQCIVLQNQTSLAIGALNNLPIMEALEVLV